MGSTSPEPSGDPDPFRYPDPLERKKRNAALLRTIFEVIAWIAFVCGVPYLALQWGLDHFIPVF